MLSHFSHYTYTMLCSSIPCYCSHPDLSNLLPIHNFQIVQTGSQIYSQFANSRLSQLVQGDGKDVKDSKDEGGPYWSLMFEVSESYCKPVNQKTIKLGGEEWPEIVKETIQGAINTKLTSADDQIVSIYHRLVLLSMHESHRLISGSGL
jgi:hypothetical protein